MKLGYLAPVAAIVFTVSAPAQAGQEHKDTMNEIIGTFTALNTQLDKVKDNASATAAAPEIEKLGEKLQAISVKAQNLKEPTAEEQEGLKKEFETKMQTVMMQYMGNLMRIGQMKISSAEFEKAIASLQPKAAPAPAPAPKAEAPAKEAAPAPAPKAEEAPAKPEAAPAPAAK